MFFRNDRSPIPIREKTTGIFRILCIGDSLTYGQGVHFDESLPSRLEYELNRSLWNERVEVINESNCGYSFFDEEALFEFRGKQHDPDLLLIILCSNDTELFGANGNYSEHIKTNWEPDGSVYPYFESSFSAFCEKVNEYGVQTLVSYYDLTNSKEEKIYSSMLSDLCKSKDIQNESRQQIKIQI